VKIEISDDGRGIDLDKVRRKALELGLKSDQELARMSEKSLLRPGFLPGFSTVPRQGPSRVAAWAWMWQDGDREARRSFDLSSAPGRRGDDSAAPAPDPSYYSFAAGASGG